MAAKAFEGRAPNGGVIRHADPRGLPGSAALIRKVAEKNEGRASEVRDRLKKAR